METVSPSSPPLSWVFAHKFCGYSYFLRAHHDGLFLRIPRNLVANREVVANRLRVCYTYNQSTMCKSTTRLLFRLVSKVPFESSEAADQPKLAALPLEKMNFLTISNPTTPLKSRFRHNKCVNVYHNFNRKNNRTLLFCSNDRNCAPMSHSGCLNNIRPHKASHISISA